MYKDAIEVLEIKTEKHILEIETDSESSFDDISNDIANGVYPSLDAIDDLLYSLDNVKYRHRYGEKTESIKVV